MIKSMKKIGGPDMPMPPKTEGPKKYVPKIQEVEIKEETSWGGESPERLRSKLGKQLLSLKLKDNKMKEEGKTDWMSKATAKSIKEQIEATREQLKK
jgi:hypothetical protein